MEGIVKSPPVKQSVPAKPQDEKPGRFPFSLFSQFSQKKLLYTAVGLVVILLILFVPIKGKSLFNRLVELVTVKEVNLVPNPGFEKGSGDKPAGWTTKSGKVESE
jgi:hypothetical protein